MVLVILILFFSLSHVLISNHSIKTEILILFLCSHIAITLEKKMELILYNCMNNN